jgi:peptidoglycan pentaglycine glycine transferase (the first glycine)
MMIEQAELKEDEKNDWNRFVAEHGGGFLQSWEWGKFQESIGRQVYFLRDDGFWALVIKYQMPLNRNYLYCPHGPVLATNIKTCGFLEALKDLAKKEKSVFLRIEPCANCTREDLNALCFVKSKDIQPHKTLVLDLAQKEEELLAKMHEKTRYNIGLAQRRGVAIKNFQFPIFNFQFNEFWQLISQTANRQRIKIFPKEYYFKQLQINSDKFQNLLFLAEYQGKAIAANLVNVFGQTATYLHGGSDNEYRALMAPHLLQWEQIKYAKNQGCETYDFWGFDEERWPGVSLFKKGFGGREVQYVGTWDYIFDKKWYTIYKLARKIL